LLRDRVLNRSFFRPPLRLRDGLRDGSLLLLLLRKLPVARRLAQVERRRFRPDVSPLRLGPAPRLGPLPVTTDRLAHLPLEAPIPHATAFCARPAIPSLGYDLRCPVSARELELHVFDSITVIGAGGRAGSA